LDLYIEKGSSKSKRLIQTYINNFITLPPLGELNIHKAPANDPDIISFLRISAIDIVDEFRFFSESFHGNLEPYLESVETVFGLALERVQIGNWDITSSHQLNRLVKAAKGAWGLSIFNTEFQLEEPCDFGTDEGYKLADLGFRNDFYPKLKGLTSSQLELIAQGVARSPLKKSLKQMWVMPEDEGIGQKETLRVLKKYKLSHVVVWEYDWTYLHSLESIKK